MFYLVWKSSNPQWHHHLEVILNRNSDSGAFAAGLRGAVSRIASGCLASSCVFFFAPIQTAAFLQLAMMLLPAQFLFAVAAAFVFLQYIVHEDLGLGATARHSVFILSSVKEPSGSRPARRLIRCNAAYTRCDVAVSCSGQLPIEPAHHPFGESLAPA